MTPTEALAAALVAAFRNPVLPGGGSGEFARAQAPHVLAALDGYALVPVGLVEAAREAERRMRVEFAYLEATPGRVVSGGVAARTFRPMADALRAALAAIEEPKP